MFCIGERAARRQSRAEIDAHKIGRKIGMQTTESVQHKIEHLALVARHAAIL
jgi:hypothetical protein